MARKIKFPMSTGEMLERKAIIAELLNRANLELSTSSIGAPTLQRLRIRRYLQKVFWSLSLEELQTQFRDIPFSVEALALQVYNEVKKRA